MSESELELARRFDRVSERLTLTPDERSEILILYPDTYYEWLRTGAAGEIKESRLADITETLENIERAFEKPEKAREWLISPDPMMRMRIPARVLRLGPIDDVNKAVQTMVGDTFP